MEIVNVLVMACSLFGMWFSAKAVANGSMAGVLMLIIHMLIFTTNGVFLVQNLTK